VRGTDGSRLSLPNGRVSWLPAVQGVRAADGHWRRRKISYAVQELRAHGSDVVHRGEQRFVPARQRSVTVRSLFFAARFSAHDALLGSPAGTALVLRFPDGHIERHAFGPRGQRRLTGLPRGRYEVRVDGPGVSFSRPLTLSRTQDVDLRVISWVDIALVGGALVLAALAILLMGRRRARRRA
jgi:hypothetical protein